MTLKELKARFDATIQAKKEKAAEIEQLKKDLEKVSSEMLSAADRGDLGAYKKLDNQKRDIEARIFVYTRSLPSAGNPVTREDAVKAWDSFAKGYNKDIKKQYEEYLSDCKALAAKYRQLVNVQNAALYEREKALQIMGEPRTSDALTMFMIPCRSSETFMRWAKSSPELAFFSDKGFYSSEEVENISQIVEGGTSV